MPKATGNHRVIKDAKNEREVPNIWRTTFTEVVRCFVNHDYRLLEQIKNVAPVSKETEKQIKEYIQGYGETLVELPEEAWQSSFYLWTENYWDVWIDLWTDNEGRSDLVLRAKVAQENETYIVEIYMVYVP